MFTKKKKKIFIFTGSISVWEWKPLCKGSGNALSHFLRHALKFCWYVVMSSFISKLMSAFFHVSIFLAFFYWFLFMDRLLLVYRLEGIL